MNKSLDAIVERRALIAREIEQLRAEDEELAVAEQVLERLDLPTGLDRRRADAPPKGNGRPNSNGRRAAKMPKTQREFVLDALGASPTALLRTRDIVALAESRWGVDIPEKSLRPLLTVMKNERRIERSGRVVALRERAHEGRRRGGDAPGEAHTRRRYA
jgi:hypothetical protein